MDYDSLSMREQVQIANYLLFAGHDIPKIQICIDCMYIYIYMYVCMYVM